MSENNGGITKKIKKVMHILNPFAGKGNAKKIKESLSGDDFTYMSDSASETSEFITKTCKENPDTCFTVYGGDGTVFRAVNALMNSGCADRATLKIVPMGSGNDFVRSFEDFHGEKPIDILTFNGRYAANVINMGFDCSVVERANKMKKSPLISGKMAYIFGVVGELFNKKALDLTITIKYADGSEEVLKDKFLLVACGNCRWYGGGFKAVPLSECDDGLIDVTLIKDVSALTFISLVGDFRKGTFVDEKTGEVTEKFKKYILYKKCVGIKIEGVETVCADGEIFKESTVEIGIIHNALNFAKD